MAKEARLTIPINIDIRSDTYSKLTPEQRVQIGSMASQFLDAFANKGIMVRPDNLSRIEEACGMNIRSDIQLVEVVQKATKRDEGQNVLTIKIDPALMPSVMEYATTVGWTVEDLMTDIANRIVRDSMAFYINSQSWQPVIYLTEEQGAKLGKLLGKRHFNGEDIIGLLSKEEVAA